MIKRLSTRFYLAMGLSSLMVTLVLAASCLVWPVATTVVSSSVFYVVLSAASPAVPKAVSHAAPSAVSPAASSPVSPVLLSPAASKLPLSRSPCRLPVQEGC